MPRRKTTRAQDRAHRIAEERELNRADAEAIGHFDLEIGFGSRADGVYSP